MIPQWMLVTGLIAAGAAIIKKLTDEKGKDDEQGENGVPGENDEHATANNGPKKCGCGSFAAADGFCKKCRPAPENEGA